MNGAPLPAGGCRAVIVGICAVAGVGSVRSVLICDDRPTVRQGVAELLRPLPSLREIRCVADGFAVVDALVTDGADLVLIDVHPASDIGQEAMDLVLGMYPSTVVVVVGSVGDLDVLVPAYLRGPRGLLLWEPPPGLGTDPARRQRKVAHRGLPRS
jgi:CheY-like chemotaxis protein